MVLMVSTTGDPMVSPSSANAACVMRTTRSTPASTASVTPPRPSSLIRRMRQNRGPRLVGIDLQGQRAGADRLGAGAGRQVRPEQVLRCHRRRLAVSQGQET